METKKKLPTGAIAFAVAEAALLLIVTIIQEFSNFNSIVLFDFLIFIALAVFLIKGKDGLFIAAPLALIALIYLINFFSSFDTYKYFNDDWIARSISTVMFTIICACLFITMAILATYLISEKYGIAQIKEKYPIFTKIYNIAFRIFVVSLVIFTVTDIIDMFDTIEYLEEEYYFGGDDEVYLEIIFVSLLSLIRYVLFTIGIVSIKEYIFPNPNKQRTGENSFDTNPEGYISLGKHICLLLFTFGIWQLIWIYKSTKFSNYVKDESERGPGAALLLYIFIPFYSYYWTYQTAKRIDKIAKDRGVQSDIATMCLVLSLFIPILPPIFMQDKINQAIVGNTAATAATNPEATKIDSVVKYKELLDQGIITEDEFEAKKKELLGL